MKLSAVITKPKRTFCEITSVGLPWEYGTVGVELFVALDHEYPSHREIVASVEEAKQIALEKFGVSPDVWEPVKQWQAESGSRRFIIEHSYFYNTAGAIDSEGYYLYVFEGSRNTRDDLQDTFAWAKTVALEDFGVPLDAWREVTS